MTQNKCFLSSLYLFSTLFTSPVLFSGLKFHVITRQLPCASSATIKRGYFPLNHWITKLCSLLMWLAESICSFLHQLSWPRVLGTGVIPLGGCHGWEIHWLGICVGGEHWMPRRLLSVLPTTGYPMYFHFSKLCH